MGYSGGHVAAIYADLFANLTAASKQELLDMLTQSLRDAPTAVRPLDTDAAFFASFGAFADDRTPEQLVADLKASRTFREKPLDF